MARSDCTTQTCTFPPRNPPRLPCTTQVHTELRGGESNCAKPPTGRGGMPCRAREGVLTSQPHPLPALHTELLEACARRGGGDGAEQQPHEQKRCQGFSQQRANMSQQRVLLPNRLMGSSAALTEGKSLGQAGGVLPCSGQATPEGWAWRGGPWRGTHLLNQHPGF